MPDAILFQLLTSINISEKPSNGVAGDNQNSIHISYIGSIDSKGNAPDNRTPRPILSMLQLIIQLSGQYPHAEIPGQSDYPNVKNRWPTFEVRMLGADGVGRW